MDNLYDVMLKAVCDFMGFESIDSPNFHKYLQDLQDSIKLLRQAYRNNAVSVDYTSANVQMAYLLGYYPHYVGMAYYIFQDIHKIADNKQNDIDSLISQKLIKQNNILNACFFAAGPAPESVAFCKYISEYLLNHEKDKINVLGTLKLNTFDLDYDKWAVSRHITREKVLPNYSDGKYKFLLEPHRLNLLQDNELEIYREIFEKSSLFFMQNCLNELAKNSSVFLTNFKYLINHAAEKSLLIVADLCEYDVVKELMHHRVSICEEHGWKTLRGSNASKIHLQQHQELPEIINKHLLNKASDLYPKINTKFDFLFFYKPAHYNKNFSLVDANEFNREAIILKKQGKYQEALSLFQFALEIRKEQLDELDIDMIESYDYLGELYYSIGSYNEALPLLKLALKIRKEQLGDRHINTAHSYNNLGTLYKSMGRYEEALPLFQLALEIRKGQLGTLHTRTIVSYDKLAELYKLMGQYENALPLFQLVLETRKQQLGDLHFDTAASYSKLAELYESMGNYKEAIYLFQLVLEINREQLGICHPYTIISHDKIINLYELIGIYSKERDS
jgi:tetratricopeptide (TPR) repeat protein